MSRNDLLQRPAAGRPRPLLKWPGGKKWLAPLLSPTLQQELTHCYYEPFVGGAAMFLSVAPKRALLGDLNGSLVRTLTTIREQPAAVYEVLNTFDNTSTCYYNVRSARPRGAVASAARFVFLNRTSWGGIQRFNRAGDFNVPFGNSGRIVCARDRFFSFAAALRNVRFKVGDFEATTRQAGIGDVIYADPPYTTCGQNNGFVRYNERLFSWEDQERLVRCARSAVGRGAFVVVSGLWHSDLLHLYRGWWAIEVKRTVCVSRDPRARKRVSEAVFFSNPPAGVVTRQL